MVGDNVGTELDTDVDSTTEEVCEREGCLTSDDVLWEIVSESVKGVKDLEDKSVSAVVLKKLADAVSKILGTLTDVVTPVSVVFWVASMLEEAIGSGVEAEDDGPADDWKSEEVCSGAELPGVSVPAKLEDLNISDETLRCETDDADREIESDELPKLLVTLANDEDSVFRALCDGCSLEESVNIGKLTDKDCPTDEDFNDKEDCSIVMEGNSEEDSTVAEGI
ncbi:hypothetical protein ACEPPN_013062 [Leptodophora sp. 'Broadleaf-Isolate-01']